MSGADALRAKAKYASSDNKTVTGHFDKDSIMAVVKRPETKLGDNISLEGLNVTANPSKSFATVQYTFRGPTKFTLQFSRHLTHEDAVAQFSENLAQHQANGEDFFMERPNETLHQFGDMALASSGTVSWVWGQFWVLLFEDPNKTQVPKALKPPAEILGQQAAVQPSATLPSVIKPPSRQNTENSSSAAARASTEVAKINCYLMPLATMLDTHMTTPSRDTRATTITLKKDWTVKIGSQTMLHESIEIANALDNFVMFKPVIPSPKPLNYREFYDMVSRNSLEGDKVTGEAPAELAVYTVANNLSTVQKRGRVTVTKVAAAGV
ncbi:hypothetical protein B0T26DRAFT_777204 [Lasiosphaeria miniovina]|uniref:Uncharacterized protein n=1 Tax=Lasiosphaeria miniovina TaxID=1954250 RepID=A0AA40ALL5_9PEZI|nr:uncharacterized protein B0T26DRAFT_777204 [Lasiosphaeria miniovina]KAK0717972.1 hypothetical protein B0T26DRAFT_777204 [Lasiosphaeria miniovina]